MASVVKSIEVGTPVSVAYNQWTQFESFPQFMEGVKSVEQLDDKRLKWRAEIGGAEREWTADIIEQLPDERIAWRSTSGKQNDGVVTFTPLGPDKTRIELRIDYDPEGITENVGQALGVVDARVRGDLERFKKFIESRRVETGAWRGEIQGGQVRSSDGSTRGGGTPTA